MKRIIAALILTLTMAVSGVYASSDKDYNAHFGDMDKNADKGVTLEEFNAFFPHAEEGKFQEADLNKDGKIDHGEWHKFKEKYGYKHIEKKGN
jgi:hypothetical protein